MWLSNQLCPLLEIWALLSRRFRWWQNLSNYVLSTDFTFFDLIFTWVLSACARFDCSPCNKNSNWIKVKVLFHTFCECRDQRYGPKIAVSQCFWVMSWWGILRPVNRTRWELAKHVIFHLSMKFICVTFFFLLFLYHLIILTLVYYHLFILVMSTRSSSCAIFMCKHWSH